MVRGATLSRTERVIGTRRRSGDLTETAARPAIPAGLASAGVVAIGRHVAAGSVPAVADALVSGGVRAFELTLNQPQAHAPRAIQAPPRNGPDSGLRVA